MAYAAGRVDEVQFSAEDATRSDPAFLARVCREAVQAGASTINLPDTVGYSLPAEHGAFLRDLRGICPELDRVCVSVHCHDDLGLAVANSLAGIEAGAGQVECTVNGIGERAGNAALEEIVMAVRVRAADFAAETGVVVGEIGRSSALVSRLTGYAVQRCKAVVGAECVRTRGRNPPGWRSQGRVHVPDHGSRGARPDDDAAARQALRSPCVRARLRRRGDLTRARGARTAPSRASRSWPTRGRRSRSTTCSRRRLRFVDDAGGSDGGRRPAGDAADAVRPGHVHAYLLPGDDGWTVVDTGLGLPDARERWAAVLDGVDGPVARIFITHFHPDHVGAARDVQELTGAPVAPGRARLRAVRADLALLGPSGRELGVAACERRPRRGEGGDALVRTDVPGHDPVCARSDLRRGRRPAGRLGARCRPGPCGRPADAAQGRDPRRRRPPAASDLPGDRPLAGHSPDPLGDYLGALAELPHHAPRVALPGHGDPIADPLGRAAELIEHHRERLDALAAALAAEPRTAYELSFSLFDPDLPPAGRRFAVTETASHLERLRREERAEREELADGLIAYRGV